MALRALISSAIAACVFALSLPAFATDGKSSLAAICNEEGQGLAHFHFASDGRVYNTSNRAQALICPVVRDRMWDDIAWAEVSVNDRNPTASVSCVLHSTDRLGENRHGWWSTAFSSRPGSAPSWQALRFARNLPTYGEGNFYIRCVIPGMYGGQQSAQGAYQVHEHD